jgi:hypothetical protein
MDTSYQCSVHLASGFRGDKKMAIQKQELPVAASLLMNVLQSLENELKLCRKHLLKVLYKEGSFCPVPLTNMAATGNNCF